MGDTIQNIGAHAVVINKSTVTSALNSVAGGRGPAGAEAVRDIVALVESSGNQAAGGCLERFLEQLARPRPEPSTVKSLWQELLTLVPALAQLPIAVAFVAGLVGS